MRNANEYIYKACAFIIRRYDDIMSVSIPFFLYFKEILA